MTDAQLVESAKSKARIVVSGSGGPDLWSLLLPAADMFRLLDLAARAAAAPSGEPDAPPAGRAAAEPRDVNDFVSGLGLGNCMPGRAAEAPDMVAVREVDIVFDGPPGQVAGRFVEVESPPGVGIRIGEWVQRENGYWALRLRAAAERAAEGPR